MSLPKHRFQFLRIKSSNFNKVKGEVVTFFFSLETGCFHGDISFHFLNSEVGLLVLQLDNSVLCLNEHKWNQEN